jgi:hypothetical protein
MNSPNTVGRPQSPTRPVFAFFSDENRLTWFCRDTEVRAKRALMWSGLSLSAIYGGRDAYRVSEDCCEVLLIAEPHFQSDVENGEAGICKQFLTSLDTETKHVLVRALVCACAKLE